MDRAALAVAALLVALRGTSMRAGFLVGSGFGIAWYAVLVPWLTVIGGDAAIALAVLEGLFYGVFGMLAGQALRIRGWLLWVPALWVATEFATASVPFGGFPWGRLAWAFAGSDFGLYAAWVGVAGVSFLVALLGALLYAWCLRHGVRRECRRGWPRWSLRPCWSARPSPCRRRTPPTSGPSRSRPCRATCRATAWTFARRGPDRHPQPPGRDRAAAPRDVASGSEAQARSW